MSQSVLDLAPYLVPALLAIHQVLEVDTTQGKPVIDYWWLFWLCFFFSFHLFAGSVKVFCVWLFLTLPGLFLRPQSVEVTILLHQAEGMQSIQDHQEVLHWSVSLSEMMISIVDRLKGKATKAFANISIIVCITQLF